MNELEFLNSYNARLHRTQFALPSFLAACRKNQWTDKL